MAVHLSLAEAARLGLVKPKSSKYLNTKTVVDGIVFACNREAQR